MENGAVIYDGPSQIDGSPIIVVVVGIATESTNSKTGAMVQTYILRRDSDPISAVRSGADISICGDCRHRGVNGKARSCYVTLAHGPNAVYRAYLAGAYPRMHAATIAARVAGRMVRLGTYGDPAAVPVSVWHDLLKHSSGRTGYTHQWRNPIAYGLKSLCMASADSAADRDEARAAGWRTFRVRADASDQLGDRESVCPASEEAGRKLTCLECGACNGTESGRRGSIAIIVHGSGRKHIAIRPV